MNIMPNEESQIDQVAAIIVAFIAVVFTFFIFVMLVLPALAQLPGGTLIKDNGLLVLVLIGMCVIGALAAIIRAIRS